MKDISGNDVLVAHFVSASSRNQDVEPEDRRDCRLLRPEPSETIFPTILDRPEAVANRLRNSATVAQRGNGGCVEAELAQQLVGVVATGGCAIAERCRGDAELRGVPRLA